MANNNNIWWKIDSNSHNRLNESSRRKYEKLRSEQSIAPPVQTPPRPNNRTGEKVLFFMIAIPIVLALGMLFPGIAHGVLAYGAWMAYKNIFE